MNYKETLKNLNQKIAETRGAIAANRILVRDSSAALGGLKTAIRAANRKGDGATVSRLSKEQNLRRSLVRGVTENIQPNNRKVLRELYFTRAGAIDAWVKAETK